MIIQQIVVLLDHVGDLGRGEALSQDLGLRLHLLHKI